MDAFSRLTRLLNEGRRAMIKALELENFKNFTKARIDFGNLTTLVGANASGKSNIRDAMRFLHGVGRGYSLAEIFDRSYGESGQVVWDGIRGGALGAQKEKTERFQLALQAADESILAESLRYEICVGLAPKRRGVPLVHSESLLCGDALVFEFGRSPLYGNPLKLVEDTNEYAIIDRDEPVLEQLVQDYQGFFRDEERGRSNDEIKIHETAIHTCKGMLERMRFMEPQPSALREPCAPGNVRLGAHGENLSAVLKSLMDDEKTARVLMSWLHELLPTDVQALEFPAYSAGRIQVALVEEGGRQVSADAASDGTLRFLGYLAAMFTARRGDLLFFEEVENAIHPARLHLLVELLEQQSKERGFQVVVTTHSAALLDALNRESRQFVYLTYRNDEGVSGVISRLVDLPEAKEVIEREGLGRLQASRWFETATYFSLPAEGEGVR